MLQYYTNVALSNEIIQNLDYKAALVILLLKKFQKTDFFAATPLQIRQALDNLDSYFSTGLLI